MSHVTGPGAPQNPNDTADSILVCLDAGSLGRRVVASLPTLFARGVSLHDRSGFCHWRSSNDNSTSEHLGVRAALEAFVGTVTPSRVDVHLPDGNAALLLISRTDAGEYTGFVMLLVPSSRVRGKGRAAPDLPIPVIRAARHWGELAMMHAAGIAANNSTGTAKAAAEQPAATGETVLEKLSKRDRKRRHHELIERHKVSEEIRQFPIALHAQRLMPLNTELRIRRYEVLLRENQANTPAGAPTLLLLSAETSGAASFLDRRVVTELVAWLAQHLHVWSDEPSQFSVNIAPASIADRGFMEFVCASLDVAKLPHGLLAFEVDHRKDAIDRQQLETLAKACEAAQIGLVIDNFTLQDNGVDLLALPALRLLKIDRSLTTELRDSRYHQAVVAGIAQMARLAGVHSVAKQLDQGEDNSLLASLGLDFVQSFAGASPIALDALYQDLQNRVLVDQAAMIDPDLPQFLRIKPMSG